MKINFKKLQKQWNINTQCTQFCKILADNNPRRLDMPL